MERQLARLDDLTRRIKSLRVQIEATQYELLHQEQALERLEAELEEVRRGNQT